MDSYYDTIILVADAVVMSVLFQLAYVCLIKLFYAKN